VLTGWPPHGYGVPGYTGAPGQHAAYGQHAVVAPAAPAVRGFDLNDPDDAARAVAQAVRDGDPVAAAAAAAAAAAGGRPVHVMQIHIDLRLIMKLAFVVAMASQGATHVRIGIYVAMAVRRVPVSDWRGDGFASKVRAGYGGRWRGRGDGRGRCRGYRCGCGGCGRGGGATRASSTAAGAQDERGAARNARRDAPELGRRDQGAGVRVPGVASAELAAAGAAQASPTRGCRRCWGRAPASRLMKGLRKFFPASLANEYDSFHANAVTLHLRGCSCRPSRHSRSPTPCSGACGAHPRSSASARASAATRSW